LPTTSLTVSPLQIPMQGISGPCQMTQFEETGEQGAMFLLFTGIIKFYFTTYKHLVHTIIYKKFNNQTIGLTIIKL